MMKKFNNFDKINEELNPIKIGYYVVKDSFNVSPGGGWRISFRKGEILKMEANNKLGRYVPIKQEWKNVAPPIQGTENFDLTRYGREYTQREMFASFLNNTDFITKKEADDLINESSKEIVIKVRDFERTVRDLGLSQNQQIKIIL